MSSFDLLTSKWIPLVRPDGTVEEAGIRDALVRAHELGDIRCDSPLATAALVRCLLAVVYRACGPTSHLEWESLWKAGRLPEDRLMAYFARFHDRFDLFSEGRPFMQVAGFATKAPGSVAQLATELASGNNPTLFDHTIDAEPPALTPAQAARSLLAAQSFALGFGKAEAATVHGELFPRPYFADAICLRGVTLWLSGRNLFQTLMLNLVPVKPEGQGRAAWEWDDPLSGMDQGKGDDRVTHAAEGPADRFAWLSRMLRLIPDADGRVRRAYFTQGRSADKQPGDPMKVFTEDKREGLRPLGLDAGKAPWRDLAAYLIFDNKLGCPIIDHVGKQASDEVVPRDAWIPLNVVGLATERGKAGKFLLWRHDRVALPATLTVDRDAVECLRIGLREAEFVAEELARRVRRLAWKFLPPDGNPDPKDVTSLSRALDPAPAYWARLEKHFGTLLADLPAKRSAAVDEWRREVEREARQAYREARDRLGTTGRALRAAGQVAEHFLADEQKVKSQREAAARARRAASKGGRKR